MKNFLLFIFVIGLGAACYSAFENSSPNTAVNAIIGDESAVEFRSLNPERLDGDLRVEAHLRYVLEKLRNAEVSHLSDALRSNRAAMLQLLQNYISQGAFPHNYDYPGERKPCFIDREGRICAVGYLVAQSVGLDAAERINARFQYHSLLDIKDQLLDAWIGQSGLSKLECAMIQPAYGTPPPSYNNGSISMAYGLPSALLSGVNIAMCTVNGVQIAHGIDSDAIAIAGMVTGVGQIVLGVANYNDGYEYDFNGIYRNQTKNAVSFVNIGIGSAALAFGTINFFVKKGQADPLTSWNLYSFPAENGSQGLALAWSKRF